jgi:hypothetical protein
MAAHFCGGLMTSLVSIARAGGDYLNRGIATVWSFGVGKKKNIYVDLRRATANPKERIFVNQGKSKGRKWRAFITVSAAQE